EQVDLYVGYGVTTSQVSLRDNANYDDNSIIVTLPADTLLYLNGQVNVDGTVWTGAQTRLGETYIGLMPYASVRTITPGEAQVYIDAYNQANAPTPTPTPSPTPTPAQQSGYYLTLGDDVPLRTVPGSQSSISAWIAEDQAVYVTGQVYNDGYSWHVSNYNGQYGYIRQDQLRPMSAQEVSNYLAQASPTPTPVATAAPYDPYATSSYGYVTADSVNFRSSPGGTRIGVLNQYAFGLVLGSQVSGTTTWYNINQGGKVGWISGNFFKVLNLTELSSFLNSSEYLEGIMNSGSTTTTTSNTTTGSATQGQVSSVEDWNVGTWQNPASSLNATYEPFNPYATPFVPAETATPVPEPTSTFVIGTMIPFTYEEDTKETQSGSGWVGLVLGGLVLIGGAGGVYAYALTQNKKRKAAARAAAARRSQSGGAQDNP
ncbi:MAG: hypothetical protein IH607_04665, partial [Firmicutes bacterium]|nr:hypothetical protein [Bacillota bacterium]